MVLRKLLFWRTKFQNVTGQRTPILLFRFPMVQLRRRGHLWRRLTVKTPCLLLTVILKNSFLMRLAGILTGRRTFRVSPRRNCRGFVVHPSRGLVVLLIVTVRDGVIHSMNSGLIQWLKKTLQNWPRPCFSVGTNRWFQFSGVRVTRFRRRTLTVAPVAKSVSSLFAVWLIPVTPFMVPLLRRVS